jgi:hypothetical protein
MTRLTLRAASILAASALVLLLAGCTPSDATANDSPDPTDSSTSTGGGESSDPSPSPSDESLADDVLFRITATATAPGGAVVALSETVYVPRAITTADAAALDSNLCDPWRSWPDAQIQDGEILATSVSGTWPADQDIPFTLGVWAHFDGSFELAQAYCSPGWLDTPGASNGHHVFRGSDPDSAGGWATEPYGFATGFDGELGPNDAILSDCLIELGPTVAGTSALALAWPNYVQPSPDASCTFGG